MVIDARNLKHCVRGAVVAGLIGGAALAAFLLFVNLLTGQDIWVALKFAGAPFLGERATAPGFDFPAILVGGLSHFSVSIAWAVPFALLAFGLSRNQTLLIGAFWGLIVWLGMFGVMLPVLGLGVAAQSVPVATAILEHLLFGVTVAAGFLRYQRPVVGRVSATAS